MALSERLAYILDFDVKGGVRSLEKVGKTADKELGKVDERLDKIAGGLTRFGAGAIAFAGIAGSVLFKMASGAAEAEANSAALEQVVGDLVAHDIEEWAKDSASAVGLASRDAIAAATSFAGLGKIIELAGSDLAVFSQDLVHLAADLAAFKDVSPEQALRDIQAAFAGSTEVMRKYNIFLDDATLKQAVYRETGEKVTGTLTTQEKILAINSELYRQSADMTGQWARESEGLAGQQAQLKANLTNLSDNIGKGVLPHLTSLVGKANDVAAGFAAMDEATGGAIGSLATYSVAALAAVGGISMLVGQIIKARDQLKGLNAALVAQGLSLGKLATVLGIAAAGYGALTTVAAGFREESDWVYKDVNFLVKPWQLLARYSQEAGEKIAGTTYEQNRFNRELDSSEKKALEHFGAITSGVFTMGQLEERLNTVSAATADLTLHQQNIIRLAFQEQLDAQAEATRNFEESLEGQNEALEETTGLLTGTTTAMDTIAESIELAKSNMDRFGEDGVENMGDVEDAAEDAEEAISDLEQAFKDLRGEISERNAYRSLQTQFDRVEQAAKEAWIAAAEGAEDADEKARDYQAALDDLRIEVLDYHDALGNLPDRVTSDVLALIDNGSVAEAEATLERIRRQREAFIHVAVLVNGRRVAPDVTGRGLIRINTGHAGTSVQGAEGAVVNRPTQALIGEAGPEAVIPLHKVPGNQPIESVLNGGGTGSGSGVHLHFHAPVIHESQFGRLIEKAREEFFRNGGRPARSG